MSIDDGNPTRKDNGGAPAAAGKIELTLTVAPWHLDIKATVENLDMGLAMLDQARRYFEAQLRLQAAAQLQQQIVEQQRVAAIVDSVKDNLRQH